jgi:hypothetical protein
MFFIALIIAWATSYMYRKNKILLYIGSSAIPLANARGSENFGSF